MRPVDVPTAGPLAFAESTGRGHRVGQIGGAVLEIVDLRVAPPAAARFEAACAAQQPLLPEVRGCRGSELRPSAEADGGYVLLVGWDSVGDRDAALAGSDAYQRFRANLADFQIVRPRTRCYEQAATAAARPRISRWLTPTPDWGVW